MRLLVWTLVGWVALFAAGSASALPIVVLPAANFAGRLSEERPAPIEISVQLGAGSEQSFPTPEVFIVVSPSLETLAAGDDAMTAGDVRLLSSLGARL